MNYSYTEKKRIRKSFAKARQCARRPVLAGDAAGIFHRFPAGCRAACPAQEPGAASRVFLDLPDRQSQRQRATRIRQLRAGRAGLRRQGMSTARPDLRFGVAFESPAGDPRSRSSRHHQGSQGTGSVHGRNSAHDDHRLLRHQRHRARHRLAAAPFAGRLLRTRSRQNAQFGQAALLGARDSLPRFVAGLRI